MTDIAKTEHRGRFPHLDMMTTGLLLFAGIAVCAAQFSGWMAGIGVAVIIFLSAGSVGAAFGFLFAVPRLVVLDTATPTDPPTTAAAGGSGPLLRSNTNLERISDWLTTMLVGVGLSQTGSIGEALYRFRLFLAETATVFVDARGVRSAGILPAVGPMILIVGLVMGFLTLYLYTRVILSGSFKRVEDDLNARAIEKKPVTGDARDALIGEAKSLAAVSSDPTVEKIAGGQNPLVGDGLDMMLNLLYQPNGYNRVIELADKLSQSPLAKSGLYWFYLAAAFGQSYRARRLSKASQDDLMAIRTKVFDAAGRAIAVHRSFADRLWQISDPDGADNDLADFRNDPEFRRLVGQPIR